MKHLFLLVETFGEIVETKFKAQKLLLKRSGYSYENVRRVLCITEMRPILIDTNIFVIASITNENKPTKAGLFYTESYRNKFLAGKLTTSAMKLGCRIAISGIIYDRRQSLDAVYVT